MLSLSVLFSFAKIWRVNNNNSITADFATLQAAHDGASSGDTIHLESSPTFYGSLTCAKKVIIIGPGYFLDENQNLQALALSAKVSQIYFNIGSAGSVVTGLDFNASTIYVYSDDIVIRRNKFSSAYGTSPDYSVGAIYLYYHSDNGSIPVSNIIITQNYGVSINVQYASTGVLITNNFISYNSYYGDETTSSCFNSNANAVALIQNNIFRRGTVKAYNSSFTNNIMYAGSFEGTGNLVSNNLANSTQFGSDNGNKTNVDMSTVFEGAGTSVSSDAQWKLKAGSPAIGAGFGSADAGIYWGNNSYVLSGLPSVPAIYFFENQPVGSSTDPIDMTIKVKSHN